MSEELKSCPFCGVNEWQYHTHFSGASVFQCEKCGTIVDECVLNTRPIEDALTARIAELENEHAVWLVGATNEIERLNARIAELEAERRWIPVSERFPEENAPVLVLTVLGGMFVDFIHGKSVVTGNPDFYELDIEDVTHWMPLPTQPEADYGIR